MLLYGKNELYKSLMASSSENLYALLEFAEKYGIKGNLIMAKIAWLIMMDENPFSLSIERNDAKGTAEEFAKKDIGEFYNLFFSTPSKDLLNYTPAKANISGEESRIGRLVMSFVSCLDKAKSEDQFFDYVKGFYIKHGVGRFGLHKAFYMLDSGDITPVSQVREVCFEDIIGYELQKEKLIANTCSFAEGKGANNVLLYGDSGTGKSTSIKAVLNMFYDKGVRMIQVEKHQFRHLSTLTESLKKRNYRFIIYMDDLSFEDFEVEYKYLKASIEGGLEEKPENVLIYATSNRRHLIKETFSEREGGDDIHRKESIEEKISLSDRFGLSIFYPRPAQKEFFDIVLKLAQRENIYMPEDQLIAEARRWGMSHSGYSGRTATQFINHLKTKN